ncbi:trimeric intracellular cation channel family protein [Corynebacterium urinipleomorphum]|uniref:trimeric intracellular cation channel family protein n=1 Tax=Corynebacterium urinipleomorphum TaxID=1852380 RepID=UPI0013900666|nr:trimeric intracellular cation channel family protein [Corynebacterium urinipleomorphum]
MYFGGIDNAVGQAIAILDLIGVFLNAIIGGTVARRMKFDAVGFMLIAIISGMAGGMMRDALIGNTPVAALVDPWYISIAVLGAAVAFFANLHGYFWELARFHGDMIILGVWCTTGTVTAIGAGVAWPGCILMGVLTATGGMVIREVLIGRIPRILNDQQMYVVPAIAGSITAMVLYNAGYPTAAIAAAPFVAFILGTAAYWAGWYVPVTMDNAPMNTWARYALGRMAKLEPAAFRRWRHTKSSHPTEDPLADDGMMPTKGEVRHALRGGVSPLRGPGPELKPATPDEFLGALYRVYVHPDGDDSEDGWARRREP